MTIFWWILIIVGVAAICYLIYYWLHNHNPPVDELVSATNLKSTFLKHLEK